MIKLIEYASKLHGLSSFAFIDRLLEKLIKLLFFRTRTQRNRFRKKYLEAFEKTPLFERCKNNPDKFLQYMAIVQAPYSGSDNDNHRSDHKGVITIAYNYAFPAFLSLFDVEKVMQRYHIVLEPSTARLFMPEIIIFDELPDPVFVQCGEETRDLDFLKRYCRSLKPVPIAANWWLNTDIFNKHESTEKRFDIIMVSSFSKLKRHELLFNAIAKAKSKGMKLTAVCIGYAGQYTKADIEKFAIKAGIADQITVLEDLSADEVSSYYNQSRINLLLSKREGYNRSLIEGMYCGVPILLREGFNFGHKYSFITPQSGAYYRDSTLTQDILNLLNKTKAGKIDALKVVKELNISPQGAADILKQTIYGDQQPPLALKASCLNGMEYFGDSSFEDFSKDYDYLKTCLK